MGFAYVALVAVYIFICFFLILVVLLQQGKGADIAGAFGGGGTQTAFGARGATTLLHKLTTGAFNGYILIAMTLTILQALTKTGSVMQKFGSKAGAAKAAPAPVQGVPEQAAPAAPAAPAPEPAKK
ncbi:MAG: preprotein translocase subunit SecG [Thermoanaerobaculia bacterium]